MNNYKQKSIKHFNNIANKYDYTLEGRTTTNYINFLLKSIKLKYNAKVLDVACGTGLLLSSLIHLYDCDTYGIDISENMIKEAKTYYPYIKFKVSDCENIDYNNEFFDYLTVCAAFHHFPAPYKFIKEAYRLLKKGGKIYITEMFLPNFIRVLTNCFILPFLRSGDVKIYSPKEIEKLLINAGFENIKVQKNQRIQIVSAEK